MTIEIWIDEEYFDSIKDSLDMDKILVRSSFDDETREAITWHYKQINQLKTYGKNDTIKDKSN